MVFGTGRTAGVAVTLALALLGTAACEGTKAHPRATANTSKSNRLPASAAGGACYLFDFEVVEQIVGTSFDVSAAGNQDGTFTCVLQAAGAGYPDLMVAVTGTDADPGVFQGAVAPKGSTAVPGLGRQAYSSAVPAAADAGPGAEVGWLSGDGRLLTLRYRCAPAAPPAEAAAVTPKLIILAKKIDRSSL
jgi:hypothetical protein